MTAYLIRRLLLVIPTLFGIIAINFAVVQFAPGGPVEQAIAELRGKGAIVVAAWHRGLGYQQRQRRDCIAAPAGSIRTWWRTSARCSASTSRR